MPLITCPDCQREISDSAPACPGCGRPSTKIEFSTSDGPISGRVYQKKRPITLSRLMMYGAIACLAYAFFWPSEKSTTQKAPSIERSQSSTAQASSSESQARIQAYANSTNLGWYGGDKNIISFDTAPEPSGAASCNVRIKPGRKTAGQTVSIKSVSGKKSLDIELFKGSWRISAGSVVPLTISFDNSASYAVKAHGFSREVSFHIPVEMVSAFHGQLLESSRMTISFAGGDEPSWGVDLAGIGRPMADLRQCAMKRILENSSSQPL